MEWTTCCSPQFILKKIDNALSRAPHSDWKNKDWNEKNDKIGGAFEICLKNTF
jgi:hypothetical protein